MSCFDGKHSFLLLSLASPLDYSDMAGSAPHDQAVPCLRIRFPSDMPILPMHAIANIEMRYEHEDVCIVGYADLATAVPPQPDNQTFARMRHYRGHLWDSNRGTLPPTIAYSRWVYQGQPFEAHFQPITGVAFDRVDRHFALITSAPFTITVLLLWTTLCSYLSGGLAGLFAEGRMRAFRGVGLWNLATILALNVRLKKPVWAENGLTCGKRWAFLIIFSVNYLGMNYAATHILRSYLGSYTPGG
jgi:hypothetical protein